METLAALGDRRAVGLLCTLVREQASSLRFNTKWATKLLVELGGIEAIPDPEASAEHAGTLGRWRLKRVIAALKRGERG
jgi:hypothetical protein